jgi:hypothetical protein
MDMLPFQVTLQGECYALLTNGKMLTYQCLTPETLSLICWKVMDHFPADQPLYIARLQEDDEDQARLYKSGQAPCSIWKARFENLQLTANQRHCVLDIRYASCVEDLPDKGRHPEKAFFLILLSAEQWKSQALSEVLGTVNKVIDGALERDAHRP